MSHLAETATRTQRFNEAVRDFKLPSPSRHAKLTPLKDGIVELRQKGASLRLIRELLATVDVAVGTETILTISLTTITPICSMIWPDRWSNICRVTSKTMVR